MREGKCEKAATNTTLAVNYCMESSICTQLWCMLEFNQFPKLDHTAMDSFNVAEDLKRGMAAMEFPTITFQNLR